MAHFGELLADLRLLSVFDRQSQHHVQYSGGWFWTPYRCSDDYRLLRASSFRGKEARPFLVLFFIVGVFQYYFWSQARTRESSLTFAWAEISSFVKDPNSSKADVSNEGRQLMVEIRNQRYSMVRETLSRRFGGWIIYSRRNRYEVPAHYDDELEWNPTNIVSSRGELINPHATTGYSDKGPCSN